MEVQPRSQVLSKVTSFLPLMSANTLVLQGNLIPNSLMKNGKKSHSLIVFKCPFYLFLHHVACVFCQH